MKAMMGIEGDDRAVRAMREILGLSSSYASASSDDEECEAVGLAVVPVGLLDEECSMPEFFRRSSNKRERFEKAMSLPIVELSSPSPPSLQKTRTTRKKRRPVATSVEDTTTEMLASSPPPQPLFDFVPKFVSESHEAARLSGLLGLFLAMPNRCRPRTEWMKNPPSEARHDPPNKKYSCQQYTSEFVDWITALAEGVVALSGGARTYKLAITDDQKTQIFEEDRDAAGIPVAIPADNRCMGCRRYFVTQDPNKCKELAFHLCKCNKRRASYCIRCRIIQWVFTLPASAVEHELPKVGCLACREPWSPSDLFILDVTKIK